MSLFAYVNQGLTGFVPLHCVICMFKWLIPKNVFFVTWASILLCHKSEALSPEKEIQEGIQWPEKNYLVRLKTKISKWGHTSSKVWGLCSWWCFLRGFFPVLFCFIIGRTASYLPSFWNEPCPADALHVPIWMQLWDINGIPLLATMQKNTFPF